MVFVLYQDTNSRLHRSARQSPGRQYLWCQILGRHPTILPGSLDEGPKTIGKASAATSFGLDCLWYPAADRRNAKAIGPKKRHMGVHCTVLQGDHAKTFIFESLASTTSGADIKYMPSYLR